MSLALIGPVALTLACRDMRPSAPAPLAHAGRFDLSAIMREAVRIARTIRLKGWTWSQRMKLGLASAWKAAKAVRAASLAPMPVRVPVPVLRPVECRTAAFRSPGYDRGIRAVTHGW